MLLFDCFTNSRTIYRTGYSCTYCKFLCQMLILNSTEIVFRIYLNIVITSYNEFEETMTIINCKYSTV